MTSAGGAAARAAHARSCRPRRRTRRGCRGRRPGTRCGPDSPCRRPWRGSARPPGRTARPGRPSGRPPAHSSPLATCCGRYGRGRCARQARTVDLEILRSDYGQRHCESPSCHQLTAGHGPLRVTGVRGASVTYPRRAMSRAGAAVSAAWCCSCWSASCRASSWPVSLLPFVGSLGLAATTASDSFEQIPDVLQPPPLPQQSDPARRRRRAGWRRSTPRTASSCSIDARSARCSSRPSSRSRTPASTSTTASTCAAPCAPS